MVARPRLVMSCLAALLGLIVPAGFVGGNAEAIAPVPAYSLDDELAGTPPMGFNNWNDTFCGPEFNEAYVKATADFIVSSGLKDAGYRYVNLDDCWARPQSSPQGSRDADGHLVPDPVRFPNGIKAVADYVHSKGLKLGIYTEAGTRTCNGQGFDGILGPGYTAGDPTYERIDANRQKERIGLNAAREASATDSAPRRSQLLASLRKLRADFVSELANSPGRQAR